MTRGATVTRAQKVAATRQAILDAAERLLAEQGLDNVTHRQISAAAGQGNNAAVGYHFGTFEDLLLAIVTRHAEPMDQIRQRLVDQTRGSTDLAAWVHCLVQPTAEYLERLGNPTWYARLWAQLGTDPRYRDTFFERAWDSRALRETMAGFWSCLADLPEAVITERSLMTRLLIVHMFAERETALSRGEATARATWSDCAAGLTDALVGLWRAPVVSVR